MYMCVRELKDQAVFESLESCSLAILMRSYLVMTVLLLRCCFAGHAFALATSLNGSNSEIVETREVAISMCCAVATFEALPIET